MLPRGGPLGPQLTLGHSMPASMGLMPLSVQDMLPNRGLNSLSMTGGGMASSLGMMSQMPMQQQTSVPGSIQLMQQAGIKMNKIWIKHLPQSATIVQLGVYFSSFGKIIDCDIIKDRQGRNTGVGFVSYEKDEIAQREVVKQHVFQGQKLVLEPAHKFERMPEFNDIMTGRLTFPPLGKASFPQDDDFEMQVNDGKNKMKPRGDERAYLPPRRVEPGPPIFGVARPLEPPRPVFDPGLSVGNPIPSYFSATPAGGLQSSTDQIRGETRPTREPSPGQLRRDDLRDYRRDPEVQAPRNGDSLEAAHQRRDDLAGIAPPLLAAPVRMDPVPVPMAAVMAAPLPATTIPIRPQPVSSSSFYGARVVIKPAPELPLHGDNLKSIYVSNLSWWTTDEDIRAMVMEVVGTAIPFNIIFDEHKPNGKSLGSVFIDVQTEQLAQLVIKGLNGKVVNRRELKAELFSQASGGARDAGDAARTSTAGQVNAVPVGEKRKPLDETEDVGRKRSKPEATEICKWHLEGGCKYDSACPLLHPDLGTRKSDGKSRSDKKSKSDDKDRRRTHRSQKDEKKEKTSKKDGERTSKRDNGDTRHRHRHQEDSEDDSGTDDSESKGKSRR
jgi:RNA recognition motif-containing protein